MRSIYCIWIMIAAVSLPGCAITQDKSVAVSSGYDISESIDQVEIDKLENIYILTHDNRILRYNSELVVKYEYSNSLVGDIVSIDARNPQKILCYIKDFNRVLVLDNTLAEINTIDLSTSDYLDVTAIGRSNDNRIWIFDPVNQVLVKINNLAETQLSSNRLSDYNFGEINPNIIVEGSNKVVLVDQEVGVLVFDNFGHFLKLIPELDVDYIQVFGEYIFFSQNGQFFQYHIQRYEKTPLNLDSKGLSGFKMTGDYIYFFDSRGLNRVRQ